MSLKDLTKEKHRDAERCAFSQKLLSGEISTADYANYLVQLGYVYQVLENKALKLNLLDDLPDIQRAIYIQKDIVELVSEDHGLTYLPSTLRYVEYLNSLNDANRILSHLYVRHMGDLYGGQIISRKVPGSGAFYKFENSDLLIITFRSKLSDDLAEEALIAFDFNISIMKELMHE